MVKVRDADYYKIYRAWDAMRQRCNNKNNRAYKYYGGRGISVCDEWNKFENFYIWAINNGHDKSLSLDRIDVNRNYEPSNCRWATHQQQTDNRRNTVRFEHDGLTLSLTQWCIRLNVSRSCAMNRYLEMRKLGNVTYDDVFPWVIEHRNKYITQYKRRKKRIQME